MIRATVLNVTLALGLATTAHAGFAPVLVGAGNEAIIEVGEGCGQGSWRGPGGGCNRFYGAEGNNRGTRIECPPGFHIGPGHVKCWPNR